ncbi:hypothetical protein ADL22_12715 [Streptomyces sp. NRRL F-4489]|nr:hypothetical protein ADL22_12715 [Streptomyces sp. NRRL F-4489]
MLVVDWDFFFPNPSYGASHDETALLYDWAHSESEFLIDMIWHIRAEGFLRYGLPLPMCQGYEGFWNRFNFGDNPAPLLYGDSNVHSGLLVPSSFGFDASAWSKVSLWDAHHDCGYKGTLEQWKAQGYMECDSWMLKHHELGSQLEVIYPPWRTKIDGIETGPLIPVPRRIDDGTNPDTTYHAIYVCRSGAWVPSWCDRQFEDFLASYGGPGAEAPGNKWTQPRPDPMPDARRAVEARKSYDAKLTELGHNDLL